MSNFAHKLSIALLQSKLDILKKNIKNNPNADIGDSQNYSIEKIERIANDGDCYQFRVQTWNELSTKEEEPKIYSLVELQQLISRICSYDSQEIHRIIDQQPIVD
jgi:DNA topoisomerase IA